MKKLVRIGFACIGLLVGVSGVAQANLITNGSFEDGYAGNASYTTLYSGSHNIPGWTVTSGSIDWINGYWPASDGSKSLDLAGLYMHGGIESNKFDTKSEQTYRVQFDMAGNPDAPYSKSLVTISTGDSTFASHIFTFPQVSDGHKNMGWVTEYFDFVGDGNPAQIAFADVTGQVIDGLINPDINLNEAYGAALDNVRVEPVPEPSTFLLLGAGLAGIGIFRRRLRRQTQA